METRLPHYVRPPLNEVAISLQFKPLKLQAALLGFYWQGIRERFPITEDQAPLAHFLEAPGITPRGITDETNYRIQEFSSTGAFIQTFGSHGSGNGQFDLPYGIAVDGSGNVWAADNDNNRIEEFSSTGVFLQAFGSYGSGPGQFGGPAGIAIDGSGNIWVAEITNNRIVELTSAPESGSLFLAALPLGVVGFITSIRRRRRTSALQSA